MLGGIEYRSLRARTGVWLRNAIGAVATTLRALLGWSSVNAFEFMTEYEIADVQAGTALVDVTAALKAFFDHCILTGARGHISAGTYLVTPGVLAFDNGQVEKSWPFITTDGHKLVKLKVAGAVNSPIITISNGTALSAVENMWRGGCLGGITFVDTTGAVAASRHGLQIRGIWNCHFGWMKGEGLRADVVRIEHKLFGGTNPDPYSVGLCVFDGVEGYQVQGIVFNNDNGVALSHNLVTFIRAAECVGGILRGLGTCNEFTFGSAGNCSGWAIDDGNVQSLSRVKFGRWELDNVENGLRLNNGNAYDLGGIRFVHRYQTGLNADPDYWPREALSLAYTASPNLDNVVGNIWHRVEAGGVKGDVGTLANFNSQGNNIANVKLDMRMSDEAAFGFADTDYYTNLTAGSVVELYLEGRAITLQKNWPGCAVASTSAQTVPNAGFGTSAAKIAFPTETYDRGLYYDAADYSFTVPFSGLYRMKAAISLAVATGTRVRMRFTIDNAGALSSALNAIHQSRSGGAQETYELNGIQQLTAGHKVWLMADQNTAGSVNLSGGVTDNYWHIEAVGARA